MAYNTEALTKLKHLKELAQKTAQKADKATTLAGYGITDAYTQSTADAKFAEKATTLAGYGITDAYTSAQTDTKISEAVAAADHMKRKIVSSTADIDLTASDASQYIYMVLKSSTKTADKYDEYMVIDGVLEKVGDWEVDLSDYAKTADVNAALDKKVDKVDGSRLMTDAEGTKLEGITEGATKVEASTTQGNIVINGTETAVVTIATDAEVTEMLNEVFADETSST